jgi:hypothetical protein
MSNILEELIAAAYDSGYIAGCLMDKSLTDEARKEYEILSKRAIDKRNKIAKRIDVIDLFGDPFHT